MQRRNLKYLQDNSNIVTYSQSDNIFRSPQKFN